MPIINTIDELKSVVNFAKSAHYDVVKPFIRDAQEKYIRPLMGRAEMDALEAAHEAASTTPAQDAILPKVQRCLGQYFLYMAAPQGLVNFSDMGVRETASRDGTAQGPRQWVYNEFRDNAIQMADELAESVIEHLEANEADFALWAASDEYTFSKELFINSAKDYSQFVNIQSNRRTWLAIRPFLKNEVEISYILSVICQAQYDELKTQIAAGTVTATNQNLLDKIQPLAAQAALYEALPFLNVIITSGGFRTVSAQSGYAGRNTNQANESNRILLLQKAEANTKKHLNILREFVTANIDDYPLIKASDCYTELPDSPRYEFPDNSSSSTFMV